MIRDTEQDGECKLGIEDLVLHMEVDNIEGGDFYILAVKSFLLRTNY